MDKNLKEATYPSSDTVTCEELQVGKGLGQHPSTLFLYW